MVAIPFPPSSTPGERPAEGQGRLVNAYAQRSGDAHVWRRVPGLRRWATTAEGSLRGALQVGSSLYAAYPDRVLRFDAAGTPTTLWGTLAGSEPVTWARNNAVTPDVVVVSQDGAFSVTSTTVSSFADADLPQPNSVAFLDGYFLFTIGDGRVFASDLNDTAIDALAFAKAEAKPDGLSRGIVSGGLFYGFGPGSIEVWQNAGTSPFPLARVAVIPVGLRGPWAVAGAEDGWDTDPVFAAADGTVRRMVGYQPEIVSTPDVERDILDVEDATTLRADVYVVGGTAIWSLSSDTWTWEYNLTTGRWHQRRSHELERWRASCSVYAFGKWLVGDIRSGDILEIDRRTYDEVGAALVFEVESGPVKKVPANLFVRRADFELVTGQGSAAGADPIETDPRVAIAWSDDGGNRWSAPLLRSLGRQGEYRTPVTVHRTGRTSPYGRRWRLVVSDPVFVSLLGGEMQAESGAV